MEAVLLDDDIEVELQNPFGDPLELYNGATAADPSASLTTLAARTSPYKNHGVETSTGVHCAAAARKLTGRSPHSPPGSPHASGLANVIMMYSPDITMDEQRNVNSRSDIGNYYSRIETEETVKCVVTTVLFCMVIVVIVLVAVLKNPGM
jgi:hypothetical protein